MYQLTNASGIYIIISLINGNCYVGSAIGLKSRKQNHFHCLEIKKHENSHLQRHYDKYGKDDLQFFKLEYCLIENLIKREQYWMDTLKPEFNISPTAGSQLGLKHSEEYKQSQRIKSTGRKHTKATKKLQSQIRTNFYCSPEGLNRREEQREERKNTWNKGKNRNLF